MDKICMQRLKNKMDQVQMVSFDMYDTLVFRRLRKPQDIFAWMECCIGIAGFQKARENAQRSAARYFRKKYGWPHASLHEIYEYWKENNRLRRGAAYACLDAAEILERKLEEELCTANAAMAEMMEYAKKRHKRVIVTTDMYLEKAEIEKILKKCRLTQYDALYVSSDVRKTKYSGTMYDFILEQEKTPARQALHIGDDKKADIKMAARRNIRTFWYTDGQQDLAESLYRGAPPAKRHTGEISDERLQQMKKEQNRKNPMGFWYVLGYQVGGPLYMGLCTWLKRNAEKRNAGNEKESAVYALSRDGYNVAKLLPLFGVHHYRYLLSSRKAMLLPHMTKLGREELKLLPPYSCGQTIGEALECAGLKDEIPQQEFQKAGFTGYRDVIRSRKDIAAVRKVYRENAGLILKICARKRAYMKKYLQTQGVTGRQLCFFDSGWSGTSQYLIEKFYKAQQKNCRIRFLYAGIRRRAGRQLLRGRVHDGYLNQYLDKKELDRLLASSAVLELFFSADSPPLKCYGKDGPVFDAYKKQEEIRAVNQGILDYVRQNRHLFTDCPPGAVERFGVKGLCRLVLRPDAAEAEIIGNLADRDSLSAAAGMKKYLAKLPRESIRQNPFVDIYWEQGVRRHPKNTWDVRLFVWCRQRAARMIRAAAAVQAGINMRGPGRGQS